MTREGLYPRQDRVIDISISYEWGAHQGAWFLLTREASVTESALLKVDVSLNEDNPIMHIVFT